MQKPPANWYSGFEPIEPPCWHKPLTWKPSRWRHAARFVELVLCGIALGCVAAVGVLVFALAWLGAKIGGYTK